MKKILIVIDMQKDFIDGSLGTAEARKIVPAVIEKIRSYPAENVFATMDTHPENYLKTQEGRNLPVKHCIKGTPGWMLYPAIAPLVLEEHIYEKPSFGSISLAQDLQNLARQEPLEIELSGLCTDICVISNALIIKAFLPETPISIDPDCCAGVTPEKHRAALETMDSCQIRIIR